MPTVMEDKVMMERPPVGHCFAPTEKELLLRYLKPLVEGGQPPLPIPTLPVYDLEPWELPLGYPGGQQGEHSFCFARRSRRFQDKGRRVRRAVGSGTWYCNKDTKIVAGDGEVLGNHTLLSFQQYEGTGHARRKINTGWVMHELCLAGPEEFQDTVICKIRNRKPNGQFACRKRRREEKEEKKEKDGADEDHIHRRLDLQITAMDPSLQKEQYCGMLPPLAAAAYGPMAPPKNVVDQYGLSDATDGLREAPLAPYGDVDELSLSEADVAALLKLLEGGAPADQACPENVVDQYGLSDAAAGLPLLAPCGDGELSLSEAYVAAALKLLEGGEPADQAYCRGPGGHGAGSDPALQWMACQEPPTATVLLDGPAATEVINPGLPEEMLLPWDEDYEAAMSTLVSSMADEPSHA